MAVSSNPFSQRHFSFVAGPTAVTTAAPGHEIASIVLILAGIALVLWLVFSERLRLVERRAGLSRQGDGGSPYPAMLRSRVGVPSTTVALAA